MRRVLLALIFLLVVATAATGVRVHALTECERWVAEYRDALAHSPAVQRANAARHRLHRYVHRVAASVDNRPKVHVLPVRYRRPKMSREEALHKMEFACDGIGLEDPVVNAIAAAPAPVFLAPAEEEAPADSVTPGLVAENVPPTSGGGGGFPLGGVPSAPGFPGSGSGGGGGFPGNPSGPGNPGTPSTPGSGGGESFPPPPPAPPTAEAPEPGSLVLLATGLIGAAGLLRRRASSRS